MHKDYKDKQDFFNKLSENYDQIQQINSGGGGIIYSGIHRRLNQKVILKKIRADRLSIIGSEREKEILRNLKHTYLPRIFDFWIYEDEIYTVMEFIEGHSFQDLLDEGKKFTEKEVIKWTKQLAEVMAYLHSEHIIHSDIKPANLMLTSKNNICLIDFNVSILQGGVDETIGYSPGYSPVEQLIQQELVRRKRKQEKNQQKETEVDRKPIESELNSVNNDRTELLDDNGTELLNDDRTELLNDDHTELLVTDDKEVYKVTGNVSKKTKKATVTKQSATGSKQSLIDELIKKYGTKAEVDEQSDIYSACATMYHILTGKRPALCYEKQIEVDKLLPSVNDALAYILMHGMEQNPKKRFENSAQFLNAVNRMMKSTKRYKRLLWKQDFCMILLAILFLGSAGAAYIGFGMKTEEELVRKIELANEQYEQRQFADTISYVEQNILNYPLYQESTYLGQVYYLMGNCYLEQGNYIEAATEYRKAILLDSNQSLYYRDYGIALARSGNLELAREALSQAEAKGLENDSILLLKGEIASLEGDYLVAINNLKECISISKQDYVKLSAGLKLNEVLELQYKEESYVDRIALLESLSKEIEKDKKLPIWENLVQVYSDYGQLVQEEKYTQLAIETLDEIINSGYSTLVEWLNKAVLLQSIQQYEEAKQCLLDAEGRYPNNYLIYKRLSFLEMDIQASYEVNQREYSKFKEYFMISDELYKNSNLKSELDMEMEYLYQIYDEIVVKGWLEE